MKITGLRVLILAPRENHHQEVPDVRRLEDPPERHRDHLD